jgi:general secretion pathway protein G
MHCKLKRTIPRDSRAAPATGSKKCAARHAFSLVELMVVIVIIGLLAGIVAVKTRSYLDASKQNAAKVEIAKIVQALDTFYSMHNRYPTNEEGLEILTKKSQEFSDGLLSKTPQDPWKRPYQYINPGRNGGYEVLTLGADGREGGEGADADVSSEMLDKT